MPPLVRLAAAQMHSTLATPMVGAVGRLLFEHVAVWVGVAQAAESCLELPVD